MDLRQRVSGLDAEHVVFGTIFSVSNRLQRVLDAVLPELTAKQFWLIIVLSLFKDPPTLGEVAEASDTSHQNVRKLLERLEAKGFVELAPDPHDSRATRIRMTAKASGWGASTGGQASSFMEELFKGISHDDLATVARSLLTIHATLGRLPKQQGETQ